MSHPFLKAATSVVISFGPFVDKTDGVTLETGLVSALDHASTGILLSKNGGTLTIRHATVTASTYDAHGCYKVTLDTTDTGTAGSLRVIYTDAATCLPVWKDFQILPATVYDALVTNATTAAGGLGDIQRMAGTVLTARDIGASVLLSIGTGTGQVKLASGYVAPNWGDVGNPTTTNTLTGTTIASTQKVDLETIKTNPVVNAGTVTFPTTATLASTTNITAGTIATVTNGVTISGTLTTLDAIWTKIKKWLQLMIRNDANVSSGNATELNEINALTGGGFGNFDPVGQSLQAAHVHLEDIEQDTAQIGVAGAGLSDIPDPLVTNSGTAQAGASGTITLATSASTTADFYKDQAIVLTGGTGAGQTNRITAYSTGRVATVQTTWVTTPDNTTTYKVLGRVE